MDRGAKRYHGEDEREVADEMLRVADIRHLPEPELGSVALPQHRAYKKYLQRWEGEVRRNTVHNGETSL